jgi:hypothetical protein
MVRRSVLALLWAAVVAGASVLSLGAQFEFPLGPTSPLPSGESAGDSIDFGDVPVGQTRTAQYTFKVLETSETAARVTIYDPCAPFGLAELAARSLTLQPGQSITFKVTFTPPEAKSYACRFTIRAEGGRPVQVKETVVQLKGRGVAGGRTPPPSESTTPSLTFPFTVPLTPPAESAGTIGGATDGVGKFSVTLAATTTVTGTLIECGGGPLAKKEFGLSRRADGFGVTASGYRETTVTKYDRVSFFGLETIDLGTVCLEPAAEGPPAQAETPLSTEIGKCPCCSITVEAELCCPKEFVVTDTAYSPQRIRIRVAYCEPIDEWPGIDVSTIPLTDTGGILWDPHLPSPPTPSPIDPARIGVTSVTVNGEALYSGPGKERVELCRWFHEPGEYRIEATVGRFNGETCTCAKEFKILPCPDVVVEPRWKIEEDETCSPVTAVFDVFCAGGADEICEVIGPWGRVFKPNELPLRETYTNETACRTLTYNDKMTVITKHCCEQTLPFGPIGVNPPLWVKDKCVELRVNPSGSAPTEVEIAFNDGGYGCAWCPDYKLKVDWGDGTISTKYEGYRPAENYVTHRYPDPGPSSLERRPAYEIQIEVVDDCGRFERCVTTYCPFPEGLLSEAQLDDFIDSAGEITSGERLVQLVQGLSSAFERVGQSTDTGVGICHVLLSVTLSGVDIGRYSDLDELAWTLGSDIAGGVFGPESTTRRGAGEGRQWRFSHSGDPSDPMYNAAKLVYIPGERPYFELTMLYGNCDRCPVLPAYVIHASLTDAQARKRVEEARGDLDDPESVTERTLYSVAIDVVLEIGLCCPEGQGECER